MCDIVKEVDWAAECPTAVIVGAVEELDADFWDDRILYDFLDADTLPPLARYDGALTYQLDTLEVELTANTLRVARA